MRRFGRRGRFATVSDFQDGKHIMVLIERAVSGRHPLKCIDLAALLHVQTHGVFNIESTLKAGALFENVEVQAISGP